MLVVNGGGENDMGTCCAILGGSWLSVLHCGQLEDWFPSDVILRCAYRYEAVTKTEQLRVYGESTMTRRCCAETCMNPKSDGWKMSNIPKCKQLFQHTVHNYLYASSDLVRALDFINTVDSFVRKNW